MRVDLRDDERDIFGQTERARVVDDERRQAPGTGHDLAAVDGVHRQEQHVELTRLSSVRTWTVNDVPR